jgi:hypothetical protein
MCQTSFHVSHHHMHRDGASRTCLKSFSRADQNVPLTELRHVYANRSLDHPAVMAPTASFGTRESGMVWTSGEASPVTDSLRSPSGGSACIARFSVVHVAANRTISVMPRYRAMCCHSCSTTARRKSRRWNERIGHGEKMGHSNARRREEEGGFRLGETGVGGEHDTIEQQENECVLIASTHTPPPPRASCCVAARQECCVVARACVRACVGTIRLMQPSIRVSPCHRVRA